MKTACSREPTCRWVDRVRWDSNTQTTGLKTARQKPCPVPITSGFVEACVIQPIVEPGGLRTRMSFIQLVDELTASRRVCIECRT